MSRSIRRRTIGAAVVTALLGALLISSPGGAAAAPVTSPVALPPTPPPNPTNGQISAAQSAKNALANRVGQLGGEIAQAQTELQTLQGKQEFAEQEYAYAVSKLADARDAATAARARVGSAQRGVDAAHKKFVQYLQASYMGGDLDGTAGSLLTAKDPGALLDRSALEQYQADNQISAMGELQRATVIKSNADAAARRAVQRQAAATKAAKAAKAAADAAVADARAQEAQLRITLAANQKELDSAQLQLATLNNQRSAFVAYVKERARLAAIAAAKARAARLAAERAAAKLRAEARAAAARAAQQRAAAIRAAHLAEQRAASIRNTEQRAAALKKARKAAAAAQSSGSSNYVPNPGSSAPSSGGWSAGEAATAVRRARSTLGTPYAWAGGGRGGPSYGVCDGGNGAPNDCHVYGYDCSGLALYAWGPYLSMDHLAKNQYYQAGSYHPSRGSLKAGDLVFWSYNGSRSGIHHVAIYIGNGQIIEAPYSGGYVQISSVYAYGGYYGATRPLT